MLSTSIRLGATSSITYTGAFQQSIRYLSQYEYRAYMIQGFLSILRGDRDARGIYSGPKTSSATRSGRVLKLLRAHRRLAVARYSTLVSTTPSNARHHFSDILMPSRISIFLFFCLVCWCFFWLL